MIDMMQYKLYHEVIEGVPKGLGRVLCKNESALNAHIYYDEKNDKYVYHNRYTYLKTLGPNPNYGEEFDEYYTSRRKDKPHAYILDLDENGKPIKGKFLEPYHIAFDVKSFIYDSSKEVVNDNWWWHSLCLYMIETCSKNSSYKVDEGDYCHLQLAFEPLVRKIREHYESRNLTKRL